MNNAVTFARAYGLVPGVALTAAQMAALASDIMWLVEQTVTLPDGSTQKALVPQVYVKLQVGDIKGSPDSSLMSGCDHQVTVSQTPVSPFYTPPTPAPRLSHPTTARSRAVAAE